MTKSNKTAPVPSYTVNGTMENRHRILTGIGVELFTGKSERDGCIGLLDRSGYDTVALAPRFSSSQYAAKRPTASANSPKLIGLTM